MRYEKTLIIIIFIVIFKTERCTNDELKKSTKITDYILTYLEE